MNRRSKKQESSDEEKAKWKKKKTKEKTMGTEEYVIKHMLVETVQNQAQCSFALYILNSCDCQRSLGLKRQLWQRETEILPHWPLSRESKEHSSVVG